MLRWVLVASVLTPSFVMAQAADPGCSGTADDRARLACYDAKYPPRGRVGAAKPAPAADPDVAQIVASGPKCDLRAIFETVHRIAVSPKGQFETTAQHRDRLHKALSSSGQPITDVLCLTSYSRQPRYDADKGALEIELSDPFASDPIQELPAVQVTDARGSKAIVRRQRSVSWMVLTGLPSESHHVPFPIDAARSLDGSVRAGIVADIVEPFTQRDSPGPIAADGIDKESVVNMIYMAPKHLVLFDNRNNKLLWSARILRCTATGGALRWRIGTCERPDL